MFDLTVSRFPGGLTNTRESGIFSDLFLPDRLPKVHEYPNDFDQFVAGDWTSTGAGTAALAAGDGGLLNVTSPVSTFQSLQKLPAAFQFTKTFRSWGRVVAQLDSLLGTILVGQLNVTATPFTGASQTDGAYFLSTVTTGALNFNIAVGGTITSVSTGVSIVAGSQFSLAYYYDGAVYGPGQPNGRVVWEATGAGVTANVRGEILIAAASTFPGAVNSTPTLAVNASTAVARVLTVDSVYFVKDRANIFATPIF